MSKYGNGVVSWMVCGGYSLGFCRDIIWGGNVLEGGLVKWYYGMFCLFMKLDYFEKRYVGVLIVINWWVWFYF